MAGHKHADTPFKAETTEQPKSQKARTFDTARRAARMKPFPRPYRADGWVGMNACTFGDTSHSIAQWYTNRSQKLTEIWEGTKISKATNQCVCVARDRGIGPTPVDRQVPCFVRALFLARRSARRWYVV